MDFPGRQIPLLLPVAAVERSGFSPPPAPVAVQAEQATRAAENVKQEVEQARIAEKRTSDALIGAAAAFAGIPKAQGVDGGSCPTRHHGRSRFGRMQYRPAARAQG
jgi:hypothetical protein